MNLALSLVFRFCVSLLCSAVSISLFQGERLQYEYLYSLVFQKTFVSKKSRNW